MSAAPELAETQPAIAHSRLALTSSASSDWGTPEVVRRMIACVLRPASTSDAIDVDAASSTYWQQQWAAGDRPVAFLDGSEGRDGMSRDGWLRAIAEVRKAYNLSSEDGPIGSAHCNPPGLDQGHVVQAFAYGLSELHREGRVDSYGWVGFSLEQLRSLLPQPGNDREAKALHPLHPEVCTVFPGRRLQFLCRPEQMIAIIRKRLANGGGSEKKRLEDRLQALLTRADDSPVTGPAPTHSNYITFAWSHSASTKREQKKLLKAFLVGQANVPRSPFQRYAIIGDAP